MKTGENWQLLAKIGGSTLFAFVCFTGVESANAVIDFSGDYAPANWTLTNSNADGFVDTTNAPTLITLTGGNDDSFSFSPGTTDYTITATSNETITYDWSYSTSDDPGFDDFFRLLNGTTTFLADTNGQSGTDSFVVNTGDTFGFRVATDDNIAGAGVVIVGDLSSAAVPFEFSPALGLLLAGSLFGGSHLYRQHKARKVILDRKV